MLTGHKLAYLLLIASAIFLTACEQERTTRTTPAADPTQAPPPAVTVAVVTEEDVTPSVTFNGRVQAVDSVELRARVEGFIEKRLFEEGAEVKAGDLMIVLEKAPYETQIDQIKGQITAAEGALRLAELQVERQSTLVERQAASKAVLDEAKAKYSQALGELQRLQAALKSAELQLSYTDIKAPIDGRIGRFAFSVGDYVTPSSDPLATIVSQDPMYVTFPVSSRQLLEVRRTAAEQGTNPREVRVRIRLPDGTIYGETGKINFVDVQVDQSTDTVIVRATFPNPDRLLVSNQPVGVIVEPAKPARSVVIPQAAISVDQQGPFVLVVGEDDKAEQRRIKTGTVQGSRIAVEEGLKEGERVIVEGLQKVRPGQVVTATVAGENEAAK